MSSAAGPHGRGFIGVAIPEDSKSDLPSDGDFNALSPVLEDGRTSASLTGNLEPKGKLYSSCLLGLVLVLQCGWSTSQLSYYGLHNDNCVDYSSLYSRACLMFPGVEMSTWSAMVNAWTVGCIFGALLSGFSADALGRKRVLVYSCAPMVIGAAAQASAASPLQFEVGRVVAGLASGAVTGVLSTYISEISPPHLRLSLGVVVQGGIVLGILMVTGMHTFNGREQWRTAAAIPAVFGAAVFILAPVAMVESPVLLLLRGRRQEALAALGELYGEDQAQTALDRIEMSENDIGAFGLPCGRLWSRSQARSFVIVVGLSVAQKLSGSDVVFDYAYHFLINRWTSYDDDDYVYVANHEPIRHAAILGAIGLSACLVTAVLVRWIGNRIMQLTSTFGALTTTVIATVMLWNDCYPNTPVVAAIFVALFNCTFGALSWIVVADVCSDRSRAKMVSIGVSLMWTTSLFMSCLTRLYVDVSTDSNDAPFNDPSMYTAIPIVVAVILVFVLVAVPNTRGKTSAEVQRELTKPMDGVTSALGCVGSCICQGCRTILCLRGHSSRDDDDDDDDKDDEETRSTRPTPQTASKSSSAASVWTDPDLLRVQVRLKSIKDIKLIGSGGYGVVYLVRYRNSQLLASKRLRPGAVTHQITQKFVEEIKLVAKLDHPNIVKFVGAAWSIEADLQALFEYMERGDLRTYLTASSTPRYWTAAKFQIAIDVVEALVYVHSFSPPLVHRDLKSRNILISSAMTAKLTDFGVSRYQSQDNTMTIGVGTSRWLAPEVIDGSNDYGPAADIFSFGVVLSELDTHEIPYEDAVGTSGNALPEVAILQRVATGSLSPTFSASCPPQLLELAQLCMSFNPRDRPTAPEIAYVLRTIKRKVSA